MNKFVQNNKIYDENIGKVQKIQRKYAKIY